MEMININLKMRKMLMSDLSLLNNMGPSQINYAKSFYIKLRCYLISSRTYLQRAVYSNDRTENYAKSAT